MIMRMRTRMKFFKDYSKYSSNLNSHNTRNLFLRWTSKAVPSTTQESFTMNILPSKQLKFLGEMTKAFTIEE